MKKLLLTLGSVAAVAAPVAAVVACGGNETTEKGAYGVHFEKQSKDEIQLLFTKDATAKVDVQTIILKKTELAKDKKITVKSTDEDKTVELTVKTAITANGDVKANLTWDNSGTATVLTGSVTATIGDENKFKMVSKEHGETFLSNDDEIKGMIEAVLKNKAKDILKDDDASKAKIVKAVNAMLEGTGKTITAADITINATANNPITIAKLTDVAAQKAAQKAADIFKDIKFEFKASKGATAVASTTFTDDTSLKNALTTNTPGDITITGTFPTLTEHATYKVSYANDTKKITIEATLNGATAKVEITATIATV